MNPLEGNSIHRAVVVGAGVAGLTAADQLLARGWKVTVLERELQVGGLARSLGSDGYTFDLGPHRFFTGDPSVDRVIDSVLGDDQLKIRRSSAVWMFGSYLHWPLSLRSLWRLPPRVLMASALDSFRRPDTADGPSFEDVIRGRYGNTLFEVFFRPYTERFLGLPCRKVSRHWADAGVDRAAIDPRLDVSNIRALIRSVLLPSSPLSFVYPRTGGIGVFCDRLARRVERAGGTIATGAGVDACHFSEGAITGVVADQQLWPCENLVWTAPLPALINLLGGTPPDLDYLSLGLLNYRIRHAPRMPYQWCYYSDQDLPFTRVSIPSNFNPALAPPGRSGACVETTGHDAEQISCALSAREPEIRAGLARVGVIEDAAAAVAANPIVVPDAYPVYRVGYEARLERAMAFVHTFRNIFPLGRTAGFWYNNMDHSIRASLDLVGRIGR